MIITSHLQPATHPVGSDLSALIRRLEIYLRPAKLLAGVAALFLSAVLVRLSPGQRVPRSFREPLKVNVPSALIGERGDDLPAVNQWRMRPRLFRAIAQSFV